MTDLPQATVSKCLQRLAGKGIELRVAVGIDKLGRQVFAARGHRTTYHIPDLVKAGPWSGLSDTERAGPRPPNAGGKGGPSSAKGRTPVPQRADRGPSKAGPGSGPSPQEPSRNTSGISSVRKTPAPSSPTSSGASRAPEAPSQNPEHTDSESTDPWAEVVSMTASGGGGLWPRGTRSTSSLAQAPSPLSRATAMREAQTRAADIHAVAAVGIVEQVGELVPSLNRTELASIGHAYADQRRAGVGAGILADSLRTSRKSRRAASNNTCRAAVRRARVSPDSGESKARSSASSATAGCASGVASKLTWSGG